MAVEPDYVWGWLQLGKLRSHFGDTAGALAAVERGLALEPVSYTHLEGAAVRRFARGEMVYGGGAECAGLIMPTEGQLRAYLLTDEGRELTLYRLFPRDMCLFSASCVLRGIQFDVLVEACLLYTSRCV